MLPDFPALKNEIQKIIFAKVRHRVDSSDSVLSQMRRFTQHEGYEMRYEQHGGTSVQEGPEQIGVKVVIPIGDVPHLIGEKLEEKLKEIAEEFRTQEAKFFFQRLHESCDKAGTSINANGAPMSADLLLQMISTVQTDFGPDGRPTNSFVIHPDMAPALKRIAEEIENDPELKRRNAEILARQREEWATRESNRKLVD